jgi:hypothetical protein
MKVLAQAWREEELGLGDFQYASQVLNKQAHTCIQLA